MRFAKLRSHKSNFLQTMTEPEIEIDMGSDSSRTDSDSPKNYQSTTSTNPRRPAATTTTSGLFASCAARFILFIGFIGVSLLALGVYYQVAVCAKYPDYQDVRCNTTSFRTVNVPFAGVDGYVAFQMTVAPFCKFPEQKQFSCAADDKLANCVATAQLNYNSGELWSCYLELDSVGCGSIPRTDTPDKEKLPGCIARFVFFLEGGLLSLFFLIFLRAIYENYRYRITRNSN